MPVKWKFEEMKSMSDFNNVKIEPHLNINIGKSNLGQSPVGAGKSIGILNRGKRNRILNNTFSGLDIGVQDEGEDTESEGNKFK